MSASKGLLTAVVMLISGGALAPSADLALEKGRQHFAACAACHSPGQSGPDLRGILGRPVGKQPGFRYSRVLKGSKLVWTRAALDAFLADPQAFLPGNVMPYSGLPDQVQRRELVEYLALLK